VRASDHCAASGAEDGRVRAVAFGNKWLCGWPLAFNSSDFDLDERSEGKNAVNLKCGTLNPSLIKRRCHMPDTSQFNIDRTHPGRWTITFSNPPISL